MRPLNLLVITVITCVLAWLPAGAGLAGENEQALKIEPCTVSLRHDEFKSIQYFGRVNAGYLKGSAEDLGLNRQEITEYMQNLFQEKFQGMERDDDLLPFFVDNPRELGYIRCIITTAGEEDQVALHIRLRSGNFIEIDGRMVIVRIYEEDDLSMSSGGSIAEDVQQRLQYMMQDLSEEFYDKRQE